MKARIREGELQAVPVVPIETQAHVRLERLFEQAGCTEEGSAERCAAGARTRRAGPTPSPGVNVYDTNRLTRWGQRRLHSASEEAGSSQTWTVPAFAREIAPDVRPDTNATDPGITLG